MKYREHRGSLSESIKTEIEIKSLKKLKIEINDIYSKYGKYVEEIKLEHVGYDKRIAWDTYYVLCRFTGEKDFFVSGMTNGELK